MHLNTCYYVEEIQSLSTSNSQVNFEDFDMNNLSLSAYSSSNSSVFNTDHDDSPPPRSSSFAIPAPIRIVVPELLDKSITLGIPVDIIIKSESLGIPLQAVRRLRSARRRSIDFGGMTPGPTQSEPMETRGLRKRSNSTGTIFVDNTIVTQDVSVTIKVVCTVIRSHILESQRQEEEDSYLLCIEDKTPMHKFQRMTEQTAKHVRAMQGIFDTNLEVIVLIVNNM
jgi:hypothetical protein